MSAGNADPANDRRLVHGESYARSRNGTQGESRALSEAIETIDIAVIGAGPAGLAAAEAAAQSGRQVVVFDAKPSPARKFLMAGKSGLNLTKDESVEQVLGAVNCPQLEPMLRAFGPEEVRAWTGKLGEPLFTGSSGRVFPHAMKGSPLLRKWLGRLEGLGVKLRTRWRWYGWEGDALTFESPDGVRQIQANATVLALGGASWARLGSDAAWVPWLEQKGAAVAPFRPANMGFDVNWTEFMRERFSGAPVKSVALSVGSHRVKGEFVVTSTGIEGSAVYAISAALRDALARGKPDLRVDLLPDLSTDQIVHKLSRPRGKASLSNHLRKTVGVSGVKAALLREQQGTLPSDAKALATLMKSAPIKVGGPRPLDEAISVAGGVAWSGVDDNLMLRKMPGTYVAGEMLDWEAPTGGYLLTACIASGRWAGLAATR